MDPPLTKEKVRVKFNGHYETWYNKRKIIGPRIDIHPTHADSRGVFCDMDGYIYVGTSLVKKGDLIQTSLGMGKRYEFCSIANTVEIYTNW